MLLPDFLSLVIDSDERWATAVHEAGHALLAWRHGLDVNRMTARPRLMALGMVAWERKEGRVSFSRHDLSAQTQLALGGIVAETVMFGEHGAGGASDLQHVSQIVRAAFESQGLGTSLGSMSAHRPNHPGTAEWSQKRLMRLENEEETFCKEQFEQTRTWLEAHQDLLQELASELLATPEIAGAPLRRWEERIKTVMQQGNITNHRPVLALRPGVRDRDGGLGRLHDSEV